MGMLKAHSFHEPVHVTPDQAISQDMDRLGLWGKDVDDIMGMAARYAIPFGRPCTPGEGVRLLFRTAWAEDRSVRKVRVPS